MRTCPFASLILVMLVSCKAPEQEPPPPAAPSEPAPPVAEAEAPAPISPVPPPPVAKAEPATAPDPSPDDAVSADDPVLKAGGKYEVMQGEEVVVMNPTSVNDGTWRFAAGTSCRIDPRATVIAIGSYRDENLGVDPWLMRYRRAPMPEAMKPNASAGREEAYPPYECPDGTVFFLEDASTLIEEDGEDLLIGIARMLLDKEPLPGTYKIHR